ncbi:MAG: DUF4382 domain-containing protein [Candidatus Omnitrophica bacterium]|nr:DUF4382 domain-containing protein [Candidatus Omnitrophota bacterium]
MVGYFFCSKKLLIISVFCISLFLYPAYVFSANTEFQRPPGGAGEPWHLALADPQTFYITIYKVALVKDDDSEFTLYENPSGLTVELMNNQFVPVSDVDVPAGHYKEIKITVSATYGLKGYCYYEDSNTGKKGYWYTKDGSDQSNIGFSESIPNPGTQRVTITDAGSGAELITYNGKSAIQYSNDIDLTIKVGERPRIRAEFYADNILELNDSTPDIGSDGGSPAQITFEDIPPVIVSTH